MKRAVLKGTRGKQVRSVLIKDEKTRAAAKSRISTNKASIFGAQPVGEGLSKMEYPSKHIVIAYDAEIHCRQVYRLRLAGMTMEKIADVLLVTPMVIAQWRRLYPMFNEAWTSGGYHADAKVAKALFKRATGYTQEAERVFYNSREDKVIHAKLKENVVPDTSAAIFWLTNRQNKHWKNRSNTEVTGADGEALRPPTIIINPVLSPRAVAPMMIEGKVEDAT